MDKDSAPVAECWGALYQGNIYSIDRLSLTAELPEQKADEKLN